MSADLANPTPRNPVRGTRPSGHQTIEAKAHCQNDPATPKPRLPDRTTQPSTPKPGASALSRVTAFRPVTIAKRIPPPVASGVLLLYYALSETGIEGKTLHVMEGGGVALLFAGHCDFNGHDPAECDGNGGDKPTCGDQDGYGESKDLKCC
jgi:hypothetical protein